MEQQVILREDSQGLSVSGVEFSKCGLVVTGRLSLGEWGELGRTLETIESAAPFWRGDWLNYGERAYGEKYSQVLDGKKYQTLANYAWVAKKVELSRRRENLSWSHHLEVAQIEPEHQVYWLDKAEQEKWGHKRLRVEIKIAAREALPQRKFAERSPRLIVGRAENLVQLEDETIDLIITSPPYNLGSGSWPMGGEGRVPRADGVGFQDDIEEAEYQQWQLDVLVELHRVAKSGASLFYNHKVRSRKGGIIHPLDWLRDGCNLWSIRQEIVWDRGSTHNHSPTLFWPEDERIYWLTKGRPELPGRPVGMSTVWSFHGPNVGTWHPAPFDEGLPRRCIEAVGREGITVLDPFAGSCTTLKVALEYGYDAIGVDASFEYLERSARDNGWTIELET